MYDKFDAPKWQQDCMLHRELKWDIHEQVGKMVKSEVDYLEFMSDYIPKPSPLLFVYRFISKVKYELILISQWNVLTCIFPPQLCRTIDDIEQVRRALRPLPEALRYREIAQCMELKSGERTARQAFSSLVSIVKSADDNMGRKIKQVVDRVADKVSMLY